MEEPEFLREGESVRKQRNRMPHWQQGMVTTFVTFHLADSVPHDLQVAWREERASWLKWHPEPWTTEEEREYHSRFSNSKEKWLDRGHGSCVLRQAANRQVLVDVLCAFEGERYVHHAWVIMPNHVHVLFSPRAEVEASELIRAWKGASARAINERVERRGVLWQKDGYNRLIRDAEHFWNCAAYIRRNPVKARLAGTDYLFVRERQREGGVGGGDGWIGLSVR